MANQLTASQVDHLVRRLKFYTDPALLICDELGYLALDQQTSNLFHQVISSRHGLRRSTIITTNTAFSEWGNMSTTPPLPRPSPIAWWRTPKSSCSEAIAFAKATRVSRRKPRLTQTMRRSVR